jgi:glycosyltransferase involved in cell wall biosynthesis
MTPDNTALPTHELHDRLHLLGERRDVREILTGCDIATLSSFGEGFPNVLGEAMACGLPCVTTDVGDAALIVGDTGIVVPPRDAARLSDGWRRLYELGETDRQALGMKARERIAMHWSLSSVVTTYEETYARLVGR